MNWEYFILFAIAALVCWALGAFAAWKGTKPGWAYGFTFLGLAIFFSFIIGMWISLERPPMRTMGETRLWYSFFLPLAGLITYARWKYKWILSFSCILSLVFICINIFKPEIHNKTLMPALQSPWFAPHVIVYMFAYAMLGAATVMAVYLLWFKKKEIERKEMDLCDNLTYVGLAFMTLGMLTGAIWAKEAWGHYWAWDPKETWAAATWFAYLAYIHFRLGKPLKARPALVILLVSFVLLQMCWYGINYLPSALYDGKATREEPHDDDVYVCDACGSRKIEIQVWVNANTNEYLSDVDDDDTDCKWCADCEQSQNFCTLSDYKQKMQDWWKDLDFITLESITGLHETNYSSEDCSQSFVDACNDWWNGQDYDTQRELYFKSQS